MNSGLDRTMSGELVLYSGTPTGSSSDESSSSELSDDASDPSFQNEKYKICQYVHRVIDFSSQYGSDTSISYTAFNIIGRQSKFPEYGDFPETFAMVSTKKKSGQKIILRSDLMSFHSVPENVWQLVGAGAQCCPRNNAPELVRSTCARLYSGRIRGIRHSIFGDRVRDLQSWLCDKYLCLR